MKKEKLLKHKRIATGLFLLMVLLFVLMLYLQSIGINNTWIRTLKAFAEAAMVGALADWFAVVALFRKPMNLSIPHTNLIEKHKKDIGNSLGYFVVDNFVTYKQIRPYISRIKLSEIITKFLNDTKNKKRIVGEIKKKILNFITDSSKEKYSPLIEREMREALERINFQGLLGEGIKCLVEEGKHQEVLDSLLEKSGIYIKDNKGEIEKRVTAKLNSIPLLGAFMGNLGSLIGNEITQEVLSYLSEVKQDRLHPIRKYVNEETNSFIKELSQGRKWSEKIEDLKFKVINKDYFKSFSEDIFVNLQNKLISELQSEKSVIEEELFKLIDKISSEIEINTQLDTWFQMKIYKFVMRNKEEIAVFISRTVDGWDARALSEKLELEVGKDLQFIRINGTLVGGGVGVLIYWISEWLF